MPKLHKLPTAEKRRLISDLSNALEKISEIQDFVNKLDKDREYLESAILREGLEKLPDEVVFKHFRACVSLYMALEGSWLIQFQLIARFTPISIDLPWLSHLMVIYLHL